MINSNKSDSPETTTENRLPPAAIRFYRGSIVESQHRAHACVVRSDGEILYSLGDVNYVTFMRSSTKPLQALLTVKSGAADRYGLTPRELAVIAGSHGGEEIHTSTVSGILAKAGFSLNNLQCGSHLPFDAAARKALRESGSDPTQLHHNCSGKHAGMLLVAKHLKCSIEDYLDPEHDVQMGINEIIETLAGLESGQIVIGIDGCSAPVHGLSMRAGALAIARFIYPRGLPIEMISACERVAQALKSHPEMVAGNNDRICTELIRNCEDFGLVAKVGAEGYYVVAWNDPDSGRGVGMSVKVEDGSQRARDPLVIALLQKFKVLPADLPDSLKQFSAGSIKNHRGSEVGEIRVVI